MAENDRFYSQDKGNVPLHMRYNFQTKSEHNILVWVAISPHGKTQALFFNNGLAITKEVYQNQCLDCGSMPFISKYYPRGGYVFWPDST